MFRAIFAIWRRRLLGRFFIVVKNWIQRNGPFSWRGLQWFVCGGGHQTWILGLSEWWMSLCSTLGFLWLLQLMHWWLSGFSFLWSLPLLCFSTPSPVTQNKGGGCPDDPDCTYLVKNNKVCKHCRPLGNQAVGFSRLARPAISGSDIPSCFMVTGFDSVAIGAQVLRDGGFSDYNFSPLQG